MLGVQPCLRKVQAAEAEGRDVPLVRRGHVLLQGRSPLGGQPSLSQMRRRAVGDGRGRSRVVPAQWEMVCVALRAG